MIVTANGMSNERWGLMYTKGDFYGSENGMSLRWKIHWN